MRTIASLTLAAVAYSATVACEPFIPVRGDHVSTRDERVAAAREDRALGVLERQKPDPADATCEPAVEGLPG